MKCLQIIGNRFDIQEKEARYLFTKSPQQATFYYPPTKRKYSTVVPTVKRIRIEVDGTVSFYIIIILYSRNVNKL